MDFPVDHLSASSITTFLRCPRQWQDKYVHENVGPSSSSLLLGSFVHGMLAEALKGRVYDHHLMLELAIAEDGGAENIIWNKPLDYVEQTGLKMVYDYYETVGKYLEVEETELEIEIEVPGVPIPIQGFIDILTEDRIVDIKTTAWYRNPPNPEWKLQHQVYQLHKNFAGENHVVTPTQIILPDFEKNHRLYVSPSNPEATELLIRQVYQQIKWAWEEWGSDEPWRAASPHTPEWIGKYCNVEHCCKREQ